MDLDYLNTKSVLTAKALDLAETLQHFDERMDDLYKINFYLMRRYKDDLLKEFNIVLPSLPDGWTSLMEKAFNTNLDPNNESIQLMIISNQIRDKMKEEMPEPWYCYGFGSIKE